jgi:peroxiredoxin
LPSAIEQVHREFGARGLAVLAISIREPRERVEAWVAAHGTTFTVLLDADGSVTQQYEVTVTPTVFIVGRDGRLLGRALGTKAWTSDRGRAVLAALTRT